MASENGQREIALMLDWENIRFGLQQRNLVPNISAIKDEAQSLGRVVVARAYADFQNYTMSNDPRRLYAAGIEPVYVPGRNYDDGRGFSQSNLRKNSVDIKLTADCVEFCHRYPNIDAYVLVSGDGDFIHLVNSLRPYGKFVAIVALSWSASPRLTESADWVRFYDIDVEPSLQREPSAHADPPSMDEMADVFETIRDIVTSQNRPLVLAALKPLLTQRMGDIDEGNFGYVKFKPLVMDAQDAGYVRVVTEGLVDWVLPADTDFQNVDEPSESEGMDSPAYPAASEYDGGERDAYPPSTEYDDGDDDRDTYQPPAATEYDGGGDDRDAYQPPATDYGNRDRDSYQPAAATDYGDRDRDAYQPRAVEYGGDRDPYTGGRSYSSSTGYGGDRDPYTGGYGGDRGGYQPYQSRYSDRDSYSPYGGERDLTVETLPDSVRRELLTFCDSLERRSRYVTFTYLVQNLSQQPWMQLDRELLRSAVNSAIQMDIFRHTTYDDFDEYTGQFRHLPTLTLNREHPLVEDALGAGAGAGARGV